jgi:hypothetical protein
MGSASLVNDHVLLRPSDLVDPEELIALVRHSGALLDAMETPRLVVDSRHMTGTPNPLEGARIVSAAADAIGKQTRIAFVFADEGKQSLSQPVLYGLKMLGYDIGGFFEQDRAIAWLHR